jgi:hypothetical protein
MRIRFRTRFFFSDSGNNLKSKACPELSRRIQNLKWGGIVAIGVAFAMCGQWLRRSSRRKSHG